MRYHGVGDGRILLKARIGRIQRMVPLGARRRLR